MPVSLRKSLPSALCILLGSLLYAFTVHLFILPGELMSSGTTGIALTVCRLTGIPLSRFILCFNLVNVSQSTITNITADDKRRLELKFSISYNDDHNKACLLYTSRCV